MMTSRPGLSQPSTFCFGREEDGDARDERGHDDVDWSAGLRRDVRTCFLFRFNVFEPDATPCAQAVPRLLDAPQEARVVLETVFEPVLFGLKADQHARRLAVARDDDLLGLSLAKKAR